MADYIPKNDLAFQDWTGNFISIANLNLTTLGFLTSDMTAITTNKTLLDVVITDNEAKQAAAKAATKKKEVTRAATEAMARALVKRIQAKVDVPADLKRQLQITVPGSSSPVPLQIPLNLLANTINPGAYELQWLRNGNSPTTMFIIEALLPGATSFVQIGAETKTTYLHAGNPPFDEITYRVRAKKGEVYSLYSNEFTVNRVHTVG